MATIHFSTAIDCGNLTAPEGGRVTFTPGVVMTLETGLDAVATYTCSVGYDLVGDTMRTCQANEQWDGTEPNCMRKLNKIIVCYKGAQINSLNMLGTL